LSIQPNLNNSRVGDPALARKLSTELEGEVLFDAFSRGRYSTDASIYQIEPIGVIVPRSEQDVVRAIQIANEEGVPVLPRGGGSSQVGQTVGEALVIDVSKHLNRVVEIDADRLRATVQPGLVMDEFNAALKPHNLMFAVDISTGSRATVGGMAGNNSCGTRSIVYGPMRDNVIAIDAILDDGSEAHFGPLSTDYVAGDGSPSSERMRQMTNSLLSLGQREAAEIKSRFPDLMRRVGGYNIDALTPEREDGNNLAHLLVGSEGTLAFSKQIHVRLHPVPAHKVLGVCHFLSFYKAMEATQHLVELGPSAIELVDRTMIDLSRDIPLFRSTVDRFVKGEPAALLLVEFAGDDHAQQISKLNQLRERMGDLGFNDAVVEATDPDFQTSIWEVRKSGLNIMMSMKGDGKPLSFIEDCAVRLEDLAEYTDRLTNVFHKHGTTGTWYAHASVGCLHVRPVLNLKLEGDAKKMRAIAEEAFAMVREYKGSHSGEHGDGLARSEFHEPMFGSRMTKNFKEVKALFDPNNLFNPGKIVDGPSMDDRSLFRFKPGYKVKLDNTKLDWSEWGGFGGAIEMCNNNGACRKLTGAVMCPSYRVTRDEKDSTRGRANTLRLAISGQLGKDALASDDMAETMKLCVGCKGCKRECPTGVDMAKMKTEFLYHYNKHHGLSWHDKIVAYLPRYAPLVSKFSSMANLRNRSALLRRVGEKYFSFSAQRNLPEWSKKSFVARMGYDSNHDKEVVLFADTFNRYFEPDNLHAAVSILNAAGYRIHHAVAADRTTRPSRPLCCGRTFLAGGLIEEARVEAQRTYDALMPYIKKNIPIVGLEPSCLLTLRDEFASLIPPESAKAISNNSFLLEEFIAREQAQGNVKLKLKDLHGKNALVHGHCHQKAFDTMNAMDETLSLIPGLSASTIESSCCGMAGAFGYNAETYDVSKKMGELMLAPAVRNSDANTIVVANGTSCRQQIKDLTGREAIHISKLLNSAI